MVLDTHTSSSSFKSVCAMALRPGLSKGREERLHVGDDGPHLALIDERMGQAYGSTSTLLVVDGIMTSSPRLLLSFF